MTRYYFFKKDVTQKNKETALTKLFLCVPGEFFEFWFT